MIVLLTVTGWYLGKTVEKEVSENSILESMRIHNPVKFKITTAIDRSLLDRMFEQKNAPNRLARIKKSHILKVGFNPNTMPFAFYNSNGELMGYDIQMAHSLAHDLGCEIEFIRFDFKDLEKALNNNVIDIAMSGIYVSLDRITQMDFTDTYMNIHPALIVKDYMKDKFKDFNVFKNNNNLVIAVLKGNAYTALLKKNLKCKIVEIDSYVQFYEGKVRADALFHSAEQGSTWVLKYPQYSVVLMKDLKLKNINTKFPL